MSRFHKHTFKGIDGRTCNSHETLRSSSVGAAEVEKERFALLLYILDGRRALWDNSIICDQEDHMCMRVVALRLSSARWKVLRPRHEGRD